MNLKDSEAYIAQGRWQEAYESLANANRRAGDEKLERAMVDLLLRAAPPASTIAAAEPVALQHSQSLHSLAGDIPEIEASELSAALLKAAIHDHGYLLVRGLFPEKFASSLCEDIDRSLQARMAVAEPGLSGSANGPWYYESPHFPGVHSANSTRAQGQQYGPTGSIRVADSPRGSFKVLEQYRAMQLQQLLSEYFGEAAVIATKKWVFRLIAPRRNVQQGVGGGWHQDGQFMGAGVQALNMWAALSPCGDGTAAPGIALIPKRIREILEFGTGGAKKRWVVGPQVIESLATDSPIVLPRFAAGDGLFFDHFSLHRSGHAPGQSEHRYALESWFYATSGSAGNAVMPLY